jgi:hypothetical protein
LRLCVEFLTSVREKALFYGYFGHLMIDICGGIHYYLPPRRESRIQDLIDDSPLPSVLTM